MRASIDSNILIYAALEPGSPKGRRSAAVITRAAPHGVLAAQSLLEFVAVVRRRKPTDLGRAIAQAEAWARVFEVAPTTEHVMHGAYRLISRHGLQVWDAVIWSASAASGADVRVTEDMHSGLTLDGVRAVDPFPLDVSEFEAMW